MGDGVGVGWVRMSVDGVRVSVGVDRASVGVERMRVDGVMIRGMMISLPNERCSKHHRDNDGVGIDRVKILAC